MPTSSERPDSVFRRALPFDLISLRLVLIVLAGVIVMLLTVAEADAAETGVSTPTAWEYAHQTAPAAERPVAPSTAADLHLATGLSIAALVVIATMVVGERTPDEAVDADLAPATPVTRLPAMLLPLSPATTLQEAA